MILRFKKIKLHNFGSYATTEIDLLDRGFCLVSGENHYVKDNALSNGSGKSTIWSAICFALTGETIQGIKQNLKNINISEKSCSVTLEFSANADEYVITRIVEPKSDLKIIKNDVDISGKGVRESEKVLAENLPDLTKDLIASTIILGQGMPNKFSSFTPSGRKALLETLTRSDFMIADIKNRLSARQATLDSQNRTYSDSLLVNRTNLTNKLAAVENCKISLDGLSKHDFDTEINQYTAQVAEITAKLTAVSTTIVTEEQTAEAINAALLQQTTEQSTKMSELNESYNKSSAEKNTAKYTLEVDIRNLKSEIAKFKSITDICPTCGQKLPNVLKPDTSKQEAELTEKQNSLADLTKQLADFAEKYNTYKASIDAEYASKIADLKKQLLESKSSIAQHKSEQSTLNNNLNSAKDQLSKATFNKENLLKQTAALNNQLTALNEEITTLNNAIQVTEQAQADLEEHLAVLKKMTTLTQRDFRGYLLEDIIKYIDGKAKEYSQTVFGTDELKVYLDSNALDITYCGKMFDSLSGGEKQRCDLILQLAIRDLLQTYLNYSSNIIVLDEIFDGLDRVSTEKIIDLITNKLRDVESIFVISHHADELELPIDSEIHVVKNEDGISEVK